MATNKNQEYELWFVLHSHYGISSRDHCHTFSVYNDYPLTRSEAMKQAKRQADNISARKFHQYLKPDAQVFNNKTAFLKAAAKVRMNPAVSDYPESLPVIAE
jgi:hypothetical protein